MYYIFSKESHFLYFRKKKLLIFQEVTFIAQKMKKATLKNFLHFNPKPINILIYQEGTFKVPSFKKFPIFFLFSLKK